MQSGEEISGVTLALSEFAYNQQRVYPDEINTREHADHSVRYLVARALLSGNVTVEDFEPTRFKDPRVAVLTGKIALRSESSLPNDALGSNIEVGLASGRVVMANVPIPPGDMRNPADEASLSKKFFALSEKVLGPERARRAAETLRAIDTLADLSGLISAVSLRPA
jgi:2-methylcitrate dehydratase